MDIEFAFLADAAQADSKLYILGAGIEAIQAQQFPASHPYLSFVVKLRLHPTECGRQHQLEIEVWDPDGSRIGPQLSRQFSAARHATDPTRPVFVQTVLNLVGMAFPKAGAYAFHIILDGQHARRVDLYLEEVAPAVEPGTVGNNGN